MCIRDRYVDGTDSLPLEETFKKVGYEYNTTANSITKMIKPTDKQEILKNNWLRHK